MIQSMASHPSQMTERDIYSVTRLNREARALLENAFATLWVEGEISNLARPASGHLYFTLKDAAAQVSCALFRNRGMRLGFKPDEGMQVVARARVSLYEPRGGFQLIVESLEEAGDGALQRAFAALKQRLDREGLFDSQHKVPLPTMAKTIGVITSPSGAAIRDVLTVLRRRFPALPVIIYPTRVQGDGATDNIVAAIRTADARAECDVLILTRGGGSLEDLWPFNEERVARAVYDCRLPMISAIGHEIDFVITDFVADQRAPTPSAAAELVSPDSQEWQAAFSALRDRLAGSIRRHLQRRREQLAWLSRRLQQQHPGQRLLQKSQRLDELEQGLRRLITHQLQQRQSRLRELSARLLRHHPGHRFERVEQRRLLLAGRLRQAIRFYLERKQQALNTLARTLDTVSPLATLERGYSITLRPSTGQVVQTSKALKIGEQIETRLAHGRVISQVTGTHET